MALTVLLAFFLSGFSALVIEVIWVRALTLSLGHTTYALSSVLAVYLGGLAIGSFLTEKRSLFSRIPDLRLYARIELFIATIALLMAPIILILPAWFSLILLLIPAVAMGATYPLLIRCHFSSGTLYGVNTAGAVVGVLFAGFYGVPALGLSGCLIVASVFNLIAYLLVRFFTSVSAASADTHVVFENNSSKAWLVVIGVGGVASFVCEVAWTRAFASIIGSSTYAFTIVLTMFLLGLALGASVYEVFRQRLSTVRIPTLFVVLLLLGFSIVGYMGLYNYLPYLVSRLFLLATQNAFFLHAIQLFVVGSVILIPTLLMGFATPLYIDSTQMVPGRVYGVLTVGNIVGALFAAFWILPTIGSEHTLLLAGGLYLVTAFIVLWRLYPTRLQQKRGWTVALLLGIAAMALIRVSWDPRLLASGAFLYGGHYARHPTFRSFADELQAHALVFYKDGISSTVSVQDDPSGQRYLRVNGKTDASAGIDMATQLLLGYLPATLAPKTPESALVIGFGSGVSLAGMGTFESLKHLDCVEIEPAVIQAAPYFARLNNLILEDPRVQVTIDDARHYLRSTNKTYDLILSEPSNPWLAGVANLYTAEAFQLGKDRLSENGLYCQWFHSYSMSTADFELIVKTFLHVFPDGMLFTTGDKDFFLIGSKNARWSVPFNQVESLFQSNPHMASDLQRLGFTHPVTLLATTFLLDSKELNEFAGNAPIHRDNRPTLEFTTPKYLQRSEDRQTLDLLLARKTQTFPPVVTEFTPSPSEWVDLNNMVGEAFMRVQRLGMADSYFSKAMELNKNSARTWTNKGRVFNAQDRHLQSEQAFRRALAIDPSYALAWFHLGMLYVNQGFDSKGLEMLEKGLTLAPGDPMGSLQASRLYIAQGNTAAAERILKKALSRPALKPEVRGMLEQLKESLTVSGQ